VAVNKLNNQELLTDVAINSRDHYIRGLAAKKLTDQTLALQINAEINEISRRHDKERYEQQFYCEKCKQRSFTIKVGGDYYSGTTDYKCSICGDVRTIQTSLGHG